MIPGSLEHMIKQRDDLRSALLEAKEELEAFVSGEITDFKDTEKLIKKISVALYDSD